MWEFEKREWKPIDDFLAKADDDTDRAYEKCGFSAEECIHYGEDEAGFMVEVRRRVGTGTVSKITQNANTLPVPNSDTEAINPGYDFLVTVWVGGRAHQVAVPDLPDLVTLLNQLRPLPPGSSPA